MYDFSSSVAKGNCGVTFVEGLLNGIAETVSVENVQNDAAYQSIHINLVWRRRVGGAVQSITVGTKWDSHRTLNFAFETRSVVEAAIPGCFLTSQADIWFYCFPKLHIGYVLPLALTREWFLSQQHQVRHLETSSSQGSRQWHTEFALVPREQIMREVRGAAKFNM